MHDYERGYLDGQRRRGTGSGAAFFGTFDHGIASAYDQGFVDGYSQKQGHIDDPRDANEAAQNDGSV